MDGRHLGALRRLMTRVALELFDVDPPHTGPFNVPASFEYGGGLLRFSSDGAVCIEVWFSQRDRRLTVRADSTAVMRILESVRVDAGTSAEQFERDPGDDEIADCVSLLGSYIDETVDRESASSKGVVLISGR
jgi:hypothetical protein